MPMTSTEESTEEGTDRYAAGPGNADAAPAEVGRDGERERETAGVAGGRA